MNGEGELKVNFFCLFVWSYCLSASLSFQNKYMDLTSTAGALLNVKGGDTCQLRYIPLWTLSGISSTLEATKLRERGVREGCHKVTLYCQTIHHGILSSRLTHQRKAKSSMNKLGSGSHFERGRPNINRESGCNTKLLSVK